MYKLKILAISLAINLVMLYLFVQFIMKPINEFSKTFARILLNGTH